MSDNENRPAGGEMTSEAAGYRENNRGSDSTEFLTQLCDMKVPIKVKNTRVGWDRRDRWEDLDSAGNAERLASFEPGRDALLAKCGDPFAVLDVDPKNGGDVSKVRNLLASMDIRVFAEVSTPCGGTHFYVAGHPDLRTKHFRPDHPQWPGLDVQASGALIYLPGSTRFDQGYTGHGYTVLRNDLAALADGGDPDGAETLLAWRDAFDVIDDHEPDTAPFDGHVLTDRETRYLDVALEGECRELAAIGRGGRNDALNRAAFKLGRLVGGAGLDEGRAATALAQAATTAGLDADEIAQTIRSGLAAGMRHPRSVPDRDAELAALAGVELSETATAEFVAEPDDKPELDRESLRDRLFDMAQLRELKPPEPLIGGMLYRNTLAQLSGSPGTFKSFVALAWSCAVAAGLTGWEGYRVHTGGAVLYIAAEGASGLWPRIAGWCRYNRVDPGALALKVLAAPAQLGLVVDVAETIELAREMGAVLIVFDTRARCTTGLEENSATEQGRAIAAAERIRAATGATVLMVHHSSRTGTAGRGSNAWDGAVWSDLRIKREGARLTVHCEKHKDVPDGCNHDFRAVPTDADGSQETLRIVQSTPIDDDLELRESETRVLDIVWTSATATGFTAPQIRDLAEAVGIRRSTAYRAIKVLVDRDLLRNVGTGKIERFIATRAAP